MNESRTDIVLRSGRFDHVKIKMARQLIDGTADLSTTPVTRRFYAGCKGQPGHFLWDNKGGRPKHQYGTESPIPWDSWDGKLQPKGGKYGEALIFYKRRTTDEPMWTAIGFWDSTVDKRPGSCSCFFADSHLSFEDMVADAKEHWPQIFARFPFEVVEVEP